MTETIAQLAERLRPRIITPAREPAFVTPPVDPPSRMLLTEDLQSGKTVVTVPISSTEREAAGYTKDDFMVKLRGNLVGAGTNRNGAHWEKADLDFGLPSVPYGPLNWLHDDRKIIGCLTDARAIDDGNTVQADSVLWGWLYPAEAAAVEDRAVAGSLYYSMECISNVVQCVGPNGCGREMSYVASLTKSSDACQHVRERSSARRFVNPIFQGAAVIVPPKAPGWANAHLGLLQEAERTMPEAAAFSEGDTAMAAQILAFVRNVA